jgi:alanine racemase
MCPITTDRKGPIYDGPWTADHGGRLTIDLGALVPTARRWQAMAAPGDCAAVVKANAYGLGLEPVSRALWMAGCTTFFVALPQEAFALRAHLPEASPFTALAD